MAHLLHDAVTLGQMQLRLLLLDCEQLRAKLGTPLIAIGIGLILVLSSVPVALAGIAFVFKDLAGWSRLESVWATFGLTVVVGGAALGCGIWWLRRLTDVFDSSRVRMDAEHRAAERDVTQVEPSDRGLAPCGRDVTHRVTLRLTDGRVLEWSGGRSTKRPRKMRTISQITGRPQGTGQPAVGEF